MNRTVPKELKPVPSECHVLCHIVNINNIPLHYAFPTPYTYVCILGHYSSPSKIKLTRQQINVTP